MTTQTILYIFTFLMIINSALTLLCYKCDSSDTPECTSHPNRTSLVDCSTDEDANEDWMQGFDKQCSKFTAKSDEGVEYVVRACMPKTDDFCDLTIQGIQEEDPTISDVHCYVCDGDGCNSASTYGVYALLLGVVAVTLTLQL